MASSLVIASTAPFEAVYANCAAALPTRATTEAVLITDPLVFPYLRKARTACLQPYHTPFTCVLLDGCILVGRHGERLTDIDIMSKIPDCIGSVNSIVILSFNQALVQSWEVGTEN